MKGILDALLLLDVPLFGELGIDVGSSVSAAVLDSHPALYSTIPFVNFHLTDCRT